VRRHTTFRALYAELDLPRDAPVPYASNVLAARGRSPAGSAVIVFDSGEWHPWAYAASTEDCVEHFRRYVAATFRAACDAGQGFVAIVRMTDRPWLLRPVALRCVHALIRVTLDHFPGRMRAVYLVGAPPLFQTVWALIKPILPEDVLKRTHFEAEANVDDVVQRALEAE